jgi:hypothetical protein
MRAETRIRRLPLVVAVALSACSTQPAPQPQPPVAAPVATTATATAGHVPAAPAAAATSAPPAAVAGALPAIATADGEKSGVRVEVTELKRSSGGTVNLKFTMINASDGPVSFDYSFVDKDHEVTDFGGIGGVHLVDPVGKKKYFVARDSENKCLCSQKVKDIPAGSRANLWAKFPAPPDDVPKISIMVPHFAPMDDVSLGR